MEDSKNTLQKRKVTKESSNSEGSEQFENGYGEEPDHDKGPKLTLVEEVLLLAMDWNRGYPSMWNDTISTGLRAAVLIELWMRGRIELEPAGVRRKSLCRRKVLVKNPTPTGDFLLDEALKIISENDPETTPDWISYLSGETWNPLKLKYQLKNVRERLAKNLVEKGVLTTGKQSIWLFDFTIHPLTDFSFLMSLFKKVKDSLLSNFVNDPHRMNPRTLSLLLLSHYSSGIEKALASLSNEDYDMAHKRVQSLSQLDFEYESTRSNPTDITWAVFAAVSD